MTRLGVSDLLHNLKVIESMLEEMTMPKVRDLDVERADPLGLGKLSEEIHEVLFTTTEGEANIMIRNVPDQDGILSPLISEHVCPGLEFQTRGDASQTVG